MGNSTMKAGKCEFCGKHSDKVFFCECEDHKCHYICPTCLNKELKRMYNEFKANEVKK